MHRRLLVFLFFLGLCFGAANLKSYDKEDYHLMVALDSFQRKDYSTSARYYLDLYTNTSNKEYLKSYFASLYLAEKFKTLEKKTNEFLKQKKEILISKRFLALALYQQKKYKDSIKIANEVLKLAKEKEASDYVVLADSYFFLKEYPKAIIYYKSAYSILPSDYIVDKIAFLLFENNQKQEAVSYLETHLKLYGFNLYISQVLSDYYLKLGDVLSIIDVYKRIYAAHKDKLIGQKIVELYFLRKDYDALAEFLEATKFNNKLLFEIYKLRKNHQKAANLALKIYEETQEVSFLAQNAMINYEENPKTKQLINDTIQKLKLVVSLDKSPVYLNYLGYTLIEHKIDIKQGIDYVKKALKLDPKNAFYLDSLAWGEFMQNNLSKAWQIINSIQNSNDKTIGEHKEKIKEKCKKNKECKKLLNNK